jgi:hypothetical protein
LAKASPLPAPSQTQPAIGGDLWGYIQARRQQRAEQAEWEQAAAAIVRDPSEAAIAANLPAPARGVATGNTRRGGGMFEIKRMDYDDAAFEFYGWNATMQRETPRLIEVRLGNNSDMRIAVVRGMIAVIREHTQTDFVWRSVKHNRDYTLSARPSDNAGLEDFFMREFFDDSSDVH